MAPDIKGAGYKAELESFTSTLVPLEIAPRVFVYNNGEDVPVTADRYAMPNALIDDAGGINIMDNYQDKLGNS